VHAGKKRTKKEKYPMRFLEVSRIAFFLSVGLSCTHLCSQAPIQIEIKSSWGGMISTPEGHLRITGKGRIYTENGSRISSDSVSELLAALDAPPIDKPTLAACGSDEKWLESNYAGVLQQITHSRLRDLSTEQIDLFRRVFTNQEDVQRAFDRIMMSWHTDDNPQLSVAIHDGSHQFGVTSDSQHPFMLPWVGTDRARGGDSCRISRAIFALMPEKFPNRERLDLNGYLRSELAEQIMSDIRPQWDLLNAQHLVGTQLISIASQYTVLKSQVSSLSSVDLDGGESWNAELRSSVVPSYLVIGASLLYRHKKLIGVEELLAKAPKYLDLIESVPWLVTFMQEHPEAKIELRYVDGRSLSAKASRDMTEDLRRHGKGEIAERIEDEGTKGAFIEVNGHGSCWARALIFPNREILLWHFQCDDPLGFKASQFSVWDYYGWRSTGTLIRPDGSLVP
jgi:hypothetical protein